MRRITAPMCQTSCRVFRITQRGAWAASRCSLWTSIQGSPRGAAAAAIDVVSREVVISVVTLERWRAGALALPGALTTTQRWTPAARLEAVITTAALNETARSA
jgi:hypothetical protein